MSRYRTPVRFLAIPAAALLAASSLLVGCAKDDASDKIGPISARFDVLYGADFDWNATQVQYEETIAACMKEKGFEYTPEPMVDDGFASTSAEDWDPVAEAKLNGYWITPASKDDLALQYGMGEPETAWEDDSFWFDDSPNGRYRQNLSDTEQTAYDEAMYGPAIDVEGEEGVEIEWDWRTGGCQGEAFHKVYDDGAGWNGDTTGTVIEEYQEYASDKVDNDPRVRKVIQK
ncbi:MAG: hypothetical protein FWD11_08875, partial [Micrococcales bacterium]|nr:hypothetical protein [Micrococcales bacterium]